MEAGSGRTLMLGTLRRLELLNFHFSSLVLNLRVFHLLNFFKHLLLDLGWCKAVDGRRDVSVRDSRRELGLCKYVRCELSLLL